MAPVKPKRPLARKSATAGPSKSKSKKAKLPLKMQKQVKTKPISQTQKPKKRKRPEYTEEQLKLPTLNSIVPAAAKESKKRGVGKKHNKVYVDDQESMMTILAMVNAEKEGQIESKIMKQRQMEEIRETRRKEAEKRAESKKGKLEEVKKDIQEKKKRKKDESDKENQVGARKADSSGQSSRKKKRVSFA